MDNADDGNEALDVDNRAEVVLANAFFVADPCFRQLFINDKRQTLYFRTKKQN